MYVGGDYIFNMTNFFGLNLSLFGAFLYTYFNFSDEHSKEQVIKVKGQVRKTKKEKNKKESGTQEEKTNLMV